VAAWSTCANLDSQGSSEEIVGRALKDFADRDEVVIATKVRRPMRPGPNGQGAASRCGRHL
jgi:aryl-alcohol dehydrogenase-like predicted oxidoreductase